MKNQGELVLNRLRWQCRRGMLELDLILQCFLDRAYFSLSSEQLVVFDRLLEADDPNLYQWFMKQEVPEDRDFAAMIEYINSVVAQKR